MMKGAFGIEIVLITMIFMASQTKSQCVVNGDTSVTLGKWAVVCLHFQIGSELKTYAFNTTVDTFSALKISGLKNALASETDNISVVLQFQNSNSEQLSMVVFDPESNSGVYREVFSFVVGIEQGKFTKFTDDNAKCDVCEGDQVCVDEQFCYEKGSNYKGEDPIFYISWVGTDSQKNHMLSHTKRLSRFYQYSVGSIYQKAKGMVAKLL